ncbi:MAG: hypothetical protein ACFB2X_08645 [Rivularia sp. (in: cyanobacteria)]
MDICYVYKIRQLCINHPEGMSPQRFCRRYFGYEAKNEFGQPRFTEMEIQEIEKQRGYRQQAINLLSEILKVKTNTIQRWGHSLNFENIPEDKQASYQAYLYYVDSIRIITASLQNLNRESLLKIIRELQAR